jgi:predicted nucleic-acid-binding protein
MHAVDTNVLARALVVDPGNRAQCETARKWLTAQAAVFVPQVVQVELVWLLARGFGLARADLITVLEALRNHGAVELQAPDAFAAALGHYQAGGDFADGIIAFEASRAGAALVTFDRELAQATGANLLQVEAAP